VDGRNVQIVIYLKLNHLIYAGGAGKAEKKSFENEDISHDVIDNTRRKNSGFGISQDVFENKLFIIPSPIR